MSDCDRAALPVAPRHRQATGAGQHVEVNLLLSLLSALVNQASGYVSAGVVPGILGNAHPSIVLYELRWRAVWAVNPGGTSSTCPPRSAWPWWSAAGCSSCRGRCPLHRRFPTSC